jgi:hypothetical protein
MGARWQGRYLLLTLTCCVVLATVGSLAVPGSDFERMHAPLHYAAPVQTAGWPYMPGIQEGQTPDVRPG